MQKTARKSLAALAKPVKVRRSIRVPKSLWIGLGGIVTVAALIFSYSRIGNEDGTVSQFANFVPTFASAGNNVVAPTATKIPAKTNTPKPATLVPVAGGYSDPTMYDDFDKTVYEGSYNNSLWSVWTSDNGSANIAQKSGGLSIVANREQRIWLISQSYDEIFITKPVFFEAKVMLDLTSTSSDVLLTARTDYGSAHCGPGDYGSPVIQCWRKFFEQRSDEGSVDISPGTWHIVRLEIDPDAQTITSYIDRQKIQTYTPTNSETLMKSNFLFSIELNNWSADQSVGYIEYVRIGVIADDPGNTSLPIRTPLVPLSTPLPGKLVLSIDNFEKTIPWLPLDMNARPTVHFVGFNMAHHPFDNILIRQAFIQAIDRQILVDMARRYKENNPRFATTLTPPETLGYDLSGEVGIGFDPQKAKELLSEAGYSDPSGFPTINFFVYPAGEITPGDRFNMANAMADMWQTYLGVTVQVQALNWNDFTSRIKTNPPDLYWIRWGADYNDPDNFLRELYHSSSQSNFGKFSNSEFDQLVDLATKSDDPSERQELYIRAERMLCENEAAALPLYYINTP